MKRLKVFLVSGSEAFGIVNMEYNYDKDKGYPIAIVANTYGKLCQWGGDEAHDVRGFLDNSDWKVLDITAEDLLNALIKIQEDKRNGA